MKKELLIFGSNGALGKGITSTLLTKDYDSLYLFDFKFDEEVKQKNFQQDSGPPLAEKVKMILVKDLSIESNVREAFNNIQPGKDKIFFLYSTVGGFAGGKNIWETEADEFDKMISMNLKTNFLIAKYFSRLVKDSSAGSICFTAAYVAVKEEKKKAAYGAAKSGLVHLIKALALEGKEINLTVNGIAPYIIDTPANRHWMSKANFEEWVKPDEIGELTHNLFTNFYFITGNIIELTHRIKLDRL